MELNLASNHQVQSEELCWSLQSIACTAAGILQCFVLGCHMYHCNGNRFSAIHRHLKWMDRGLEWIDLHLLDRADRWCVDWLRVWHDIIGEKEAIGAASSNRDLDARTKRSNQIARTIEQPAEDLEQLRVAFAQHYGCFRLVTGANGKTENHAKCCITQLEGPSSRVELFRFLEEAVTPQLRWILGLMGEEYQYGHVRNGILLATGLARAMEQKQICILPWPNNHHNSTVDQPPQFYLKIWCPTIRNLAIDGPDGLSRQCLRYYENHPFEFPANKLPFTRVLSHFAQVSYRHALRQKWITPQTEPRPNPFGSPLKDDLLLVPKINHEAMDSPRKFQDRPIDECSFTTEKCDSATITSTGKKIATRKSKRVHAPGVVGKVLTKIWVFLRKRTSFHSKSK
ncbi:hypothetical protein ACA910_009527 [Epithemia clementina (nom. ined.)]